MATTVEIHIRAASDPATPKPGVVVEIAFDAAVDSGSDTATVVQQTARVVLDDRLTGRAVLTAVDGPQVRAHVLADDGAVLVARSLAIAEERVDLVLTDTEVERVLQGGQRLPDTTAPRFVRRSVRLVPTGPTRPDYPRSTLAVAAVESVEHAESSGLDAVLPTSKGKLAIAVELTAAALPAVGRVEWAPAHLAVDGSFTVDLPVGPAIGWLWWLAGTHAVLGFVPDDLSRHRGPLVLTLPALAAGPSTNGSAPAVGAGCGGCATTAPARVDETELAENPQVYAEDPGTFCRPFASPERIVGEKVFSVIARVTQPALGALGSRRLRALDLLQLDGDRLPARPPARTPARPRLGRGLRARVAGTAPVAAALATLDLLPRRHELPARYDDLLRRLSAGRRQMDADHPLQWEDDIAQYQASEVALGHVLQFRVRWRSNGYSLGTVAKTLTLAPRQARRIQKIEWQRSERASRRERTSLADRTDDAVVHERDFSDAVSAHLEEWSSGGGRARRPRRAPRGSASPPRALSAGPAPPPRRRAAPPTRRVAATPRRARSSGSATRSAATATRCAASRAPSSPR